MSTPSQGLVDEYLARQRLAEIGYTSDISKLPAAKAAAFIEIASEIDKLRREDARRGK